MSPPFARPDPTLSPGDVIDRVLTPHATRVVEAPFRNAERYELTDAQNRLYRWRYTGDLQMRLGTPYRVRARVQTIHPQYVRITRGRFHRLEHD